MKAGYFQKFFAPKNTRFTFSNLEHNLPHDPKHFRYSKEQGVSNNQIDETFQALDFLLNYFTQNLETSNDSFQKMLHSLVQMKPITFPKFGSTQQENENAKMFAEKILKSELCQKKKLFLNVDKKVDFASNLMSKDLEMKFEMLMSELIPMNANGRFSLDGKNTRGPILEQLDSISNKLQNNVQTQKIDSNECFNVELKNTTEICQKMTKSLKNANPEDVNFLVCKEFFQTFQKFQIEFQNSIGRFCDKMLIVNTPKFSKLDINFQYEDFSKTFELIKNRNSEFEKFAYTKLFELREQNTQLMIVQNHINRFFKKSFNRK